MPRTVRGFTLIEVLVGLSLLGVLLGALYSGLHLLGRAWTDQQERMTHLDRERLAQALIRRALRETVPLRVASTAGDTVLFEGEPDTLRFVTIVPRALGGDLGWFALSARAAVPGLTLEVTPLAAHAAAASGATAILLPEVTALRLRYFGRADNDSEPRWHTRWHEQPRLPDLVALDLGTGSPRTASLDLIVHLAADAESGSPAYLVASDAQ